MPSRSAMKAKLCGTGLAALPNVSVLSSAASARMTKGKQSICVFCCFGATLAFSHHVLCLASRMLIVLWFCLLVGFNSNYEVLLSCVFASRGARRRSGRLCSFSDPCTPCPFTHATAICLAFLLDLHCSGHSSRQ